MRAGALNTEVPVRLTIPKLRRTHAAFAKQPRRSEVSRVISQLGSHRESLYAEPLQRPMGNRDGLESRYTQWLC